jgi:retinol-binding protein 3
MLRGLLLLLFVGIGHGFGQTIIPDTPAGKTLQA